MPFKKRVYKRKPYRRVPIRKVVQKAINKNIELKKDITTFAGSTIQDSARAPIDVNLSGIAQGDDQGTRSGRALRITSIKGDFFITGADATNSIRVILYKPKNNGDSLSGDALQFNQVVDTDKYVVFRDLNITTSAAGNDNRRVKFWKSWGGAGLEVKYDGITVNDCVQNLVRLYMVSDSLAIADPGLNGGVTVFFRDA